MYTDTHLYTGRHLSSLPHLRGNEDFETGGTKMSLEKNQSILGKSKCFWGHGI